MAQEFINSFQKGLNSDFSVVYQPDGTWRYAKNIDVISQDGNNYTVKDTLGNTLLFTINSAYSGVYTTLATPPTPLAFIAFADKLIVLSTNTSGNGYLEIGMVKMNPYGEGIMPVTESWQANAGYTPLYHHVSLNGSLSHRIEGFAFSENELINRIYWTDNYNPPRVFNTSDPIFTTYIASGDLVNGEQYMVLQGAITYSGTVYAPGVTAGNVFTAGATSTYTATSGTSPVPLVVKYYPYQLLDWTPSRAVAEIKFLSYGSGSVYCGDKIYFTRLTTADGSYSTTWSYGSSPIHVGTENSPQVAGIPYYHNFAGAGTETQVFNSGKSVKLTIDNIDTNFSYLEVACAEYDTLSSAYRSLFICNREEITGSTMTVEHTGTLNLGNLTLDDVTLFPASILNIKTINTNKNYNLIGNITERAELDIDFSSVTATSFEYPMNCHSDAASCSLGGMAYHGAFPSSTTANPAVGSVKPWQRYYVVFGDNGANTVTYNAVNYVTGDVITGVTASGTITCAGTAQVRPCVTRNRYTSSGGDRVENAIQLATGFWTYKDPAVHSHALGYWSGETYRFAIVLLDTKGNPFYARWIADYTFPTQTAKSGIIRSDLDASGNPIYSLNPSGIKFSNISIPASLIDQVSAFMIVRAERDPIAITQGLVTQVVREAVSPDVYRPAAFVCPSADFYARTSRNYIYLSPDLLADAPLKGTIGGSGDYLDEASFLSAYQYRVAANRYDEVSRAEGGREQIYSKYLDYLIDVSATRTAIVTTIANVAEADNYSLESGIIFNNDNLKIGVNVSPYDLCIAGGAYNINAYKNTGCKKTIVQVNSDFTNWDNTVPYYQEPDDPKILMNYKKANKTIPDLYGGSGEVAKENTFYMSTGHLQPITTQVKNDTYDAGTDSYIFNDVEVFGGDCFLSLVDIGYGLWNDTFSGGGGTFSYAWTFPCECSSNYELRRGHKTSNVGMYYTGTASTDSIVYLGPASEVVFEDYSYNKGYSVENNNFLYNALPVNFVNASQFKQRIRYAGPKVFGEIVDSFRTFANLDYKDLSGQSGRINNIKVKKDIVLVWQDLALNTVPILERQVLSSSTNAPTIIGTGGVVDRYDVISSYFGNQHQWGVTDTEYGFAWFDMHRKAFLIVDVNSGGVSEVSLVQGLQGFFNEAFVESGANIVTTTNILNSQDFSDYSDRPLVGTGITGVFDPKNKMTYLTFKFALRKLDGVAYYWRKDFTIGYRYDDREKFFVAFYDWTPSIATNFNQWVFSVNDAKNTTQYISSTTLVGQSFVVGETISYSPASVANAYLTGEYICIANVTVSTSAYLPDGVNGATYWALVNQSSQMWAHNQPTQLSQTPAPDYLYNKFYGKVVDNQLSIVVNPNGGTTSFFGLSIEQNTPTNVNYTTIKIDGNNGQTAQDTGITSTNINFRYVYNKIVSSLPRMANGARILSNHLQITFTKKNWTSDPRTLTGATKILQSVKTLLGFKK